MLLSITKFSILLLFLITLLSATTEVRAANYSFLSSPDSAGTVLVQGSLAGLDNVWVRWTDNNNNVRYKKTLAGGYYVFSSWQKIPQSSTDPGLQTRDKEFNTCLKPDRPDLPTQDCTDTLLAPSSGYVRQASTANADGAFGCIEDPHTLTAITPAGWGGSFTIVTGSFGNADGSVIEFDPIYYSNPSSAFPTASISGPALARPGDSVGYNSTAQAYDVPLAYIQMWYRLKPATTWTALGGACLTSPCPTSGNSNFTTATGTYDVVVNAHNLVNKSCSGNLEGLHASWADCGPNSRILLYSYPAPTGRISVDSTGSFNCSGNSCWGSTNNSYIFNAVGTDANNKLKQVEIWAAKTDGTNWTGNCPVRVSSSNKKWCLLRDSSTFTDRNTFTLSSGNWKAPAAGKYYIVINAYNSYPGNNACSGNPMEPLLPGWARCSSTNEDYIELDLVTPGPNLGTLTIKADTAHGGITGGSYTISGLRSPVGQNYYNTLSIQQAITGGNDTNVNLAGVAFTSKASPPQVEGTYGVNSLYAVTKSVFQDNGFMVLYANKASTASYYTASGNIGLKSFDPDLFYVYYNGNWTDGNNYTGFDRVNIGSPTKISVNMYGLPNFPNGPVFSVQMFKSLDSHTWGTYGYLQTGTTEKALPLTPSAN